jgi:hypothetical protein
MTHDRTTGVTGQTYTHHTHYMRVPFGKVIPVRKVITSSKLWINFSPGIPLDICGHHFLRLFSAVVSATTVNTFFLLDFGTFTIVR